ncbi:flagellar basal body L-ring protein FlgH [Microvirga terricola]|uniref:Flagellar L-ring protein n=1 Tax=Microvirga terricola TaxID=2719797 RepID=A0ABX0V5A2_9HYPH|nr:flagellar basal body L-ring protein FlgH [Microvirga terricola]NIX75009.1 flagellar basal body L-ring protein FlgH [Microvirga terricola]
MRHILVSVAVLALGACAINPNDIGREPSMTPVGYGLTVAREPVPTVFASPARASYNSLWSQSSADLFQDPRAKKIGDVVTVNILIDDKAQFDNTTDRSRKSKANLGFDVGFNFNGRSADYKADGDIRSASSSEGQGSIDRSEKLRLSVAAVVTEVLPNGNVVISGSQEIRVNFEVRVLNIAGIVRPGDISRKNTIGYDKIAEARVSYGGRGRLTEVQQPALGQQIYDAIAPF